MKVGERYYRTIWPADRSSDGGRAVEIIDQTKLPHIFEIARLETVEDAAVAIRDMWVRGAPLIGATGAYGLALAMAADDSDRNLAAAYDLLYATRPTAVDLRWGLRRVRDALRGLPPGARAEAAFAEAAAICEDSVASCAAIGDHGLPLIAAIAEKKGGEAVNILTHCNAGWLATVDWGTATAPIYKAHDAGIPVHVWVDETRPRNQGAALTAWELGRHGVPHTVIVDNAGGHLMQRGLVDMVITGTDRTTAAGDVCNKIGTYLKALAAYDNDVPFYVGLPHSTVDWELEDGMAIPIEQRAEDEVAEISGRTADGRVERVRLLPDGSVARNDAFDVTPARLVTGLITERGVCEASRAGLLELYPERGERRAG